MKIVDMMEKIFQMRTFKNLFFENRQETYYTIGAKIGKCEKRICILNDNRYNVAMDPLY